MICLQISDGEQALILASRSLGQDNGPMVRRLVERSHANRNIEENLKACLSSESDIAQYLSQWYEFCNSKTQLEAETSRKFMTEMFSKQEESVTKKLLSMFKIYFEDPRMVCIFGLEDVPRKHFGPAESEGYQNLFKNIYTQGLNSNSPPDDVLYQAYLLRKKMRLRFFEDYNNGKLPKALEIIKQKYLEEQQIAFESGKPVSANKRRSPRKQPELNENKPKKMKSSLKNPLLPYSPAEKRDMSSLFERSETSERSPSLFRRADADGNIPHVGQTGSATTQFSKKPKTRELQRRKMMKKWKKVIDERKEDLAQELFKNRQRYILKDISPEELNTRDDEYPEVLAQIIETYDAEEELLSVDDIAMVGSNYEPKYKLWETLKAIEVDEDTDFIAEDWYYEVNMGSSIAAAVKLFFERCIRSETDKSTTLKKIAFQYVVRESSEIPYIAIMAMTNRGLNGNKYQPFVFQYVLPAGRLGDAANIGNPGGHLEGVWNVKPEYDSISDACSVRRIMKYLPNIELRNNIVETVTRKYQLERLIEDENDKDVILGADGASVNTYAIAELKLARKESLVLVKIITTGSENLTLEVYKPSGQGKKIWNRNQSFIVKKRKDVIKVTGVCVKVELENFILSQTPTAIIKFAESNASL